MDSGPRCSAPPDSRRIEDCGGAHYALICSTVQPFPQKFFTFAVGQISGISPAVPAHLRGVSRSSRTLGRDAVDAYAPADERRESGRRSRVVLMPRRWHQLGDDAPHRTRDGGKKARSPERARRKPLKPIAQGRPDRFGTPVVTNSCAFYFCTRGCGCA